MISCLLPKEWKSLMQLVCFIQVIGETAKKTDDWTSSKLFCNYTEVYWRGVFGCRNIISHEYGNVDPEQIFVIIKKHLPELIACTYRVIEDLKTGKYDDILEKGK